MGVEEERRRTKHQVRERPPSRAHASQSLNGLGAGGFVMIMSFLIPRMVVSCETLAYSQVQVHSAANCDGSSFLAGFCTPLPRPTPLSFVLVTPAFFSCGRHGPSCSDSQAKHSMISYKLKRTRSDSVTFSTSLTQVWLTLLKRTSPACTTWLRW